MKIDLHVHVVGNGRGGSGCWYRPRGWTKWAQPWMLRSFGLAPAALHADLEGSYLDRLRGFLAESSLEAAVILAQDDPYRADGQRIEGIASFHVPNDYVLALAQRHPELLAGVSIHPARPDALEELDRCLAAGAVLLKCLPNCQNIDWSERRYTKFLERMAEAGLPMLAHTGSEHTLPVIDANLAHPRVLLRPLQIGVKCIAAHCGTAAGPFDRSYLAEFFDLLSEYPTLYGDNSAFNVPTRRLNTSELVTCVAFARQGRILHGSDAPVPVMGHHAWLRGQISRRAFQLSRRESNPLERDVTLKRAAGWPERCFTEAATILRLVNRPVHPTQHELHA
jgi:predicted TIM-barrel fold metal-dependent hydrolase